MKPPDSINLHALPSLGELFARLNAGKHLNRLAEPHLWAELTLERETYTTLFAALGYALRFDERGFAWFHVDEASANVSKSTRQFALVFMLLFEHQADLGRNLQRFADWLVDRAMLEAIVSRNLALLQAEDMGELESLVKLMNLAASYGFVLQEPMGWRVLPAICRYLDRFEALARQDAADVQAEDAGAEADA